MQQQEDEEESEEEGGLPSHRIITYLASALESHIVWRTCTIGIGNHMVS